MSNLRNLDSIIFGGNGQDGFLMARYIIKQKKKVLVVIRNKDANLTNLKKKYKNLLQVKITNKLTLNNYIKIFKKYKFKKIFFFAGLSKIPVNNIQKKKCINSNYIIFRDLLKSCLKQNLETKILYTSSGEIFGSHQSSAKTENSKLKADNCYSECKIKCIKLIDEYRKNHHFFIVNAICYNHESIFTPKNHLIRTVLKKLKNKKVKKIKIYNPNDKRNLSHAYDFLPLFDKTMNRNKGEDYVFANSSNTSIKKIVTLINKKYKKKIKYTFNKNVSFSRVANNRKIIKTFGYKPNYSFKKIIERMISYQKKKLFIT